MKRFKTSTFILAVVLLMLITASGLFSYFYTHTDIPKLYFEGDITDMLQKSDVRSISVRYTDGDFSFAGFAELKVQGTSSLEYDKKNYTIKLFEDSDHNNKMKVDLGWGAQNKYCLKANWIDHTQSRNVVTAKLASQVQARYNVLADATQERPGGRVPGGDLQQRSFPWSIHLQHSQGRLAVWHGQQES